MDSANKPCCASAACPASRRPLSVKRVDQCETLDELFTHCLPSFGGAYLRRIYSILDTAIGSGYPLTVAVAGPVTVSGQHLTWLIPLLETGWVAYLSTTDAICYHDGHRALDGRREDPFFEVPIFGDDGSLRDEGTIRVTDVGFDEEVLFEQDRFLSAVLMQADFQKEMTGTEMRYLLGKYYAAQEQKNGVSTGLLSTCHRLSIPVLVGAPADGSIFLNSMKLWALKQLGMVPDYKFRLDLHAEVLEACAYHRWGLFDHPKKGLATLILGGGIAKNYNLQPEPALSQVLGIKDARGYSFDVQIVSAPVTDGSLSSCPPAEAVTWGKVDRQLYQQTTESMQADFSIVMPFIVKALLDNRTRYATWAERMGEAELFAKHPKAAGYLRPRGGFRLFDQRETLVEKLKDDIRSNQAWLLDSLNYSLAGKP
jgi:deoxyhypusine synthase